MATRKQVTSTRLPDSLTPQRARRVVKRRSGQHPTADEAAQIKTAFLAAFRESANVRLSCDTVGVSRTTVYDWCKGDLAFKAAFADAEEDANDLVRAELRRRAMEGVEEPVVQMGRLALDEEGHVLKVRKYSDQLMSLLAKARLPEFHEKQHLELTGKDGGAVETAHHVHFYIPEEQPPQT